MIDKLLDLDLLTGLLLFVLVTVFFGLSIYLLSYRLLKNYIEKKHERTGRVLFRVSAALLGLILSISFANQRINYIKLIDALEVEASKVVEIHMNLEIYNTPKAQQIQSKIREYVGIVSYSGWDPLFEEQFDSKEFISFREIYREIYELEVDTPLQERLKDALIKDVEGVSDLIQVRLYSTRPESNNLIYTSVFGIVICMLIFAVYPPDRLILVFVSGYLSFIAVTLYFIIMMTSPLEGPLQISGEPFKLLQETIEKNY